MDITLPYPRDEAASQSDRTSSAEAGAAAGRARQESVARSTPSTEERSHRLIIERMREGAITVDRDGHITYCNPGFAKLVGRTEAEMLGERISGWLVSSGEVELAALLEGREQQSRDFDLLVAGRDPIPVAVSAAPLDDKAALCCLIVTDLSARRDVERLRAARADLEVADRRKNEFIAMLGHELRNPLAPIRQAVEMLEAHRRADEPAGAQRARNVIARQTVHLTRLVDDLLDAGRITQGTLVIKPVELDLREVAHAAVESVSRLIQHRGHQLRVQLPSLPVRSHGDPVRLTQVVTNLLSNAAKYTPDGGEISLTMEVDEAWVGIIVRDTGRGIAPDVLPHVFDPFVQAHTTIDRSAGGIGVGLTLVKRLVQLHCGEVRAHSDGVGRGAEFHVRLPRAALHEQRDARDRLAPEEGRKRSRHILIVDDNEDAADMMAMVLQAHGHRVDVAYDGEEALELARLLQPDTLLVDIGLPGIDGYTVARRLREEPAFASTLLIALTGYGQHGDRRESEAAGFDHHMVKPVDSEKLEELFER